MNFEGVFVALVTPFTRSGQVDYTAFGSHVDWLIENGVHGLVPCGTTGESPTLLRDERLKLIAICVDKAKAKGLSVIAGCGTNSTDASSDLIKDAEAAGCDASLVVTPYYNKPTQAGLIAHYMFLADRASKPLVLYNVPGRTQVSIALETAATLFEHPRIQAIKEASGQYAFWLSMAQITKDAGKTLLAGDDDAYAVIQALGGKGIISASANALPAAFVKLDRLMREAKWERAFELQVALAPLVKAFFSETNPAPVKFALHAYREMANTVRLPLVPVSSLTEAIIRREWEKFSNGFSV